MSSSETDMDDRGGGCVWYLIGLIVGIIAFAVYKHRNEPNYWRGSIDTPHVTVDSAHHVVCYTKGTSVSCLPLDSLNRRAR